MTNLEKSLAIIEKANNLKGFYINVIADRYSEPGYSDPETLIVTANWNNDRGCIKQSFIDDSDDDSLVTISNALEQLGCSIEWEDEWTDCAYCGGLVRTKPDSYGWMQSFYMGEHEIICHECIKDDIDRQKDYIEDHIGNSRKCLTINIDLEQHGFVHIDQKFEHGWHGGQDASPTKIATYLRSKGVTRFIFVLDSVGQFDMGFSVWIDEEESQDIIEIEDYRDDEDPAEVLKRGLSKASLIGAHHQEGIQVLKIRGDDITHKVISPQDFIDGKALDYYYH
jgi:hypothetical protein